MTLSLYDYSDTYKIDQCSNIFNQTTTISGDYERCSQHAFVNNSPFFILTGLNFEDSTLDFSDSECIIPYRGASPDTINEWISSLSKCTSTDKCYKSNDNYHYGSLSGYSLYLSPLLMPQNNIPDISINEFVQDFNNLTIDLSNLHNNFFTYKQNWYDNVTIIKNQYDISVIGYNTADNKPPDSTDYDENLYKVKKDMYELYSLQSNLEAHLNQNKINYNYYKDRLTIINEKLKNSQNFFNTLMNKNSGALGELNDSIYNTNVSIAENIILHLVIIISIYIYFKYINN